MKIHILSRSSWFEPHRIRQQLAKLLSKKYSVEYHSPKKNLEQRGEAENIKMGYFPFIERWASVPLVSYWNAWLLRLYVKKNVAPGDVLFSFLPELSLAKIPNGTRLFFVLNDDFSAMAPRISAWWIRFLIFNGVKKSNATLYLSKKLMESYPAKNSFLFYPWSDKKSLSRAKDRNVILYWGYISHLLNFSVLEEMAKKIEDENFELKILLVGPLDPSVESTTRKIVAQYKCVEVRAATPLELLCPEEVLFGIEILSDEHKNSINVEIPNKAPRLLSYGIPVVYKNCSLLDYPFFIEYHGDLPRICKQILDDEVQMIGEIDKYLSLNNSEARLKVLSQIIG